MTLADARPGDKVTVQLCEGPRTFTVIEHKPDTPYGHVVEVESGSGWRRCFKAYIPYDPGDYTLYAEDKHGNPACELVRARR